MLLSTSFQIIILQNNLSRMRLFVRHHSSLPGGILNLFRRDKVPEVTSFAQHAQHGAGSCVDKVYPTANLKTVFSGNIPSSGASKQATGLLGYPLFSTAQGFFHCWFLCEIHCKDLVDQILSSPPGIGTLKLFDDLSNAICVYADCVKFIAENAPNDKIARAAIVCNANAHEYVEKLNTNVDLYRAIKAISEDSETVASFNDEDITALHSFLHDMELSGIHLPADIRQSYIQYMSEISRAGGNFLQLGLQPALIKFEDAPEALRNYKSISDDRGNQKVEYIELHGPGSEHAMTDIREFAFRNYHAFNQEREDELMNLLRARHSMARSLGFHSFSERELRHTMAGSPDSVASFLTNLHSELKPLVDAEFEHIKYAKADDVRHDFSEPKIYPGDGQYYSRVLNERFLVENHKHNMFLDLLEFENVIEGLNVFCEDILKISLVAESPMVGELIDNNVVKVGVFDEREGLIGYIYLDLYERENKTPRTCLHTITCGTRKQIPVVVLQCSFLMNPRKQGIGQYHYPRINLDQVQTLFHEFGHALHAILGRTTYQATSGTRGPTDFSEIPSMLFENFISHPEVYYAVINPFVIYNKSDFQFGTQNLFNTPYSALKTETSILYSMLDQELHSSSLPSSTKEVADKLFSKHSHLSPILGAASHQRFSHLYFYGARYYSYLWSQSIANLIFYNLFHDQPFNEASGDKLKEFLKQGSGTDFKSSLNELVGYDFGENDMIGAIVEPLKVFNNSYLDQQDISKKWW